MSDLDATFELLSSMSPKIKKKEPVKKSKKSPHKLAIKNHIRRSSIYDKSLHSHYVRDTSVIIIDDSILSNSLSPKPQLKIIKTPIIISSSSESESEINEIIKDESPVAEKSKFVEINNWLSENEKADGYSEIYSFEHNSFSESDDDKINSSEKSETKQKSPSGVWKVTSIETKLGKEPLRSNDDDIFTEPLCSTPLRFDINETQNTDIKKSNPEIDNKSDTSEPENIAAKLLDDLYGTSWRENKEQVLSKSEPRKQNKPSSSRLLKTERKKKRIESPWSNRLKNICNSDTNSETDTSSSESYKSIDNSHCKKLNFSESEDDSNFSSNMTPSSTKNKKSIPKSRSSTSSNDIDFNENDNDSLGTRVRKRLAKKAQTNNNLTKNKTKLETKEKNKKNPTTNTKTDNTKETNKNKKKTNQQNDHFGYNERKFSFLKSLSGGIPPWQCDPDAHFYKTNFKTKKSALAKKLFDLYNEKIFKNSIPSETVLEWNDRMRGTAGFCYNKRVTKPDGRIFRSCRIVLATKILDTPDRLRDTLVHEMCHAATWLVNNVSDGHGQYWKSWAHKALTAFPELPPIKRCHDYQIHTKYTYKCVDCGYSIGRHSKSLDIERKRCGYCYGKFEIFVNKVNKFGEKQITPATPKGKTSGFALFVKENYNSVKSANMKHGEVMKILGQKFSELKFTQNGK